MSKLNKLQKDLRSSAKLNKFQALKLKGGDDKRNRGSNPGVTSPVTTAAAAAASVVKDIFGK